MSDDWPQALFLLLVSPAVGSFLGVLVDRLPSRGIRALLQPSRCATCTAALAWRDMVPVFSTMVLGGRCRVCGTTIPGHLLRIEIAALLAGLVAVLLTRSSAEMWLTAALFWCLIALFYTDLLQFRLPDALTLTLFVLGLAMAWLDPERGLANGLFSAAIAVTAFWVIRTGYFQWRGREGLGLGDVKLMAGIGAALGWALVPVVTLVAAGMALTVVAVEAILRKTAPGADTRLPLGSYLCAATVLLLVV
ncbi:MAG: A24 family peptidase [Rhodobacter sp.]|jgi:leader peptidase (prepilin peptidase)/N-methyltransferase|nr:A24 family peptidase [Rhodobacter sp.]